MAKNLLIVESPAKAKTIEKYLGKDFKVESSYGHIRDLAKGNKGVDIENDFQPSYIVSPGKEKVVKKLETAAKKVSEVWLATDEDREGEAISWHLCEVLGLDPATTKRIVFREITKPAIQSAIQNPKLVDGNLVHAQQARRILDRLVGFELSGILWRKVKNKLSAGRVQSVTVKLVVEREREIQNFDSQPYFKVVAIFNVLNKNGKQVELIADLSDRLSTVEEAEAFLEKCKGAAYNIEDIKVKPTKRNPSPPFTTSTLQQEASRKLGFAVRRTMSVAQKLYEQGFISYMRTDSISLSQTAMDGIANQIKTDFGDNYLRTKQYKSKKADAQEAHEAIRPTYFDRRNVSGDKDEQRLYELIWKRTVASQMSPAELENTTVKIGVSTQPDANFVAKGQVLIFDGFLKLYMEAKDEDEDDDAKGILPPLNVGQKLDLKIITSTERFTRAPARFTEASLVKKLEELGIGRPSTYAPTISKIMEKERGYVTKESRDGVERKYRVLKLENEQVSQKEESEMTGATSNRLYPSDLGMVVTDFLDKHFDNVMNYGFTADIEKQFDTIADGTTSWKDMLNGFYHPFHKDVEETLENAERAKGTRILGTDPASGHTVLAQVSRYGPVLQIGTLEEVGEEGKPRFAPLKIGQSIETISYEEAMEQFKLPKDIGTYLDIPMIISNGRFGPYIKYGEKFVSIPKDEDPLEVTEEQAVELVKAKIEEDRPVLVYEGLDVTQGKGRFGPFLKWNNFFINIPRRFDPDNLTKTEMEELIAAKKEKEANRYIHRWPENDLAVENGRWGPFIRWKKKSIKLPKIDDKRQTQEDVQDMTMEQAMALVEEEYPTAFEKKKKAAAKKKAAEEKKAAKAAKKKATPKKTTTTKKKATAKKAE